MKSFKDWRLLISFTIAFIALWIAIGGGSNEDVTDPRRSSFNATYPGFKAWFLLLQDLGIKTERLTGEFPKKLTVGGTLVIAEPIVEIDKKQAHTILDWVRGGGRLVYMTTRKSNREFQDRLGVRQAPGGFLEASVFPAFPTPLTQYAGKLYAGTLRLSDFPDNSLEEYGDKRGPLLVRWKEGKGRITVLSDGSALSNQFIDRDGNAKLGVWLAGNGPILFDEVHNGYLTVRQPSFWRQLGKPLQYAFLQMVLAGLLVAWTFSRRFGLPIPPETERRTTAEYIMSLGKLLSRAGADTTALEVIGGQFRHELVRWAGAPEDLPDEMLLNAAAERSSLPRETLQKALQASHGKPPPGMTPLQACRLIATVRKELELHGRYAAL